MELNLEQVKANVQAATTQDLLDRATAYRDGMEPEALELIEEELARRGVAPEAIHAHGEKVRQTALPGQGRLPLRCARCDRPAVWRGWRWHRLWGLVPLFPRPMAFCEEHRPA